ncbi:unnamed protein product [Dovyalis caffra]|uniref:NB-ARC domain-containing protein n=1 Tax=Dovyalis caffra TaxID=77055 RepID=A0AAV1QSQ8_9ROSI|nr:unnamed protein product [Dovyalis caffra]
MILVGCIANPKVALLKGIHKEVEVIKDDLEAIRAFLKVADSKAKKEGINEGVKIWVKQAQKWPITLKMSLTNTCFLGHNIARHEIASEILDIQKVLQTIKEISVAFQFISSEQGASSNARRAILHDPRMGSIFIEQGELVGIESPRDKLTSYSKDGHLICWYGGVGKTTLAKKVYDSLRVKDHFKCHAWAMVSQSYEAKKECCPENIVTVDESSLIGELRNYLQLEGYFIVIDDREFEGRCPTDLEELSRDILGQCRGLPLAIVAIGGLLASKEKVDKIEVIVAVISDGRSMDESKGDWMMGQWLVEESDGVAFGWLCDVACQIEIEIEIDIERERAPRSYSYIWVEKLKRYEKMNCGATRCQRNDEKQEELL